LKTYLKIEFSSEGPPPSGIIKKLEDAGWRPVIGQYDFVMEGGLGEGVGDSYRRMIDQLTETLRGTKVRFHLHSQN